MYAGLWQATKFGAVIRYSLVIGLSPKRRWLMVMPPDFFESYEKYA